MQIGYNHQKDNTQHSDMRDASLNVYITYSTRPNKFQVYRIPTNTIHKFVFEKTKHIVIYKYRTRLYENII